jgi:hypothetical protein
MCNPRKAHAKLKNPMRNPCKFYAQLPLKEEEKNPMCRPCKDRSKQLFLFDYFSPLVMNRADRRSRVIHEFEMYIFFEYLDKF